MKRFSIFSALLLALLALSMVHANGACLKTGLQSDAVSLADTVFFDDASGTTTLRFAANYVWIGLDANASGSVTVQRGVRLTNTTFRFVDDAQIIKAGGHIDGVYEGCYCFKFTKTSAADKILWSGGTCGADKLEGAGSPIAKTSILSPLFSSKDITTGMVSYTFTYPADGVPVEGALSAYLSLSWKSFTGKMRVTHMFTALPSDTNCTTLYNGVTSAAANDTLFTQCWIDSASVKQNATLETVVIPIRLFEGGVLGGYYHVKITTWSGTDIENMTGDLVVIY